MDKLTNQPKAEDENTVKSHPSERARSFFKALGIKTAEDKGAFVTEIIIFTIALLFSRCHVIFGTHPLGLAFLSVLPSFVWSAAIGTVAGSLTLGESGVIYAIISMIIIFLRVVISDGGKRGGELFSESLLLRMSAAVIGGFVGAVYEILLSGFNSASILFGIGMILIPPALTFLFSGIYSTGVSYSEIVRGSGSVFSLAGKRDEEKYNLIFFQLSALAFLFFLTLSLGELELFGISAAYVFVILITLLVAKRFGAVRALATGFISSLGISGVFSVSFALAGLCSGILFVYGTPFALIGGGAALSAWSAYSSGLSGFLTTLPEYLIAASIAIPFLKKLSIEKAPEQAGEVQRSARDMVGTMALTYQSGYSKSLDALEESLGAVAAVINEYSTGSTLLTEEEYSDIATEISVELCSRCKERELCRSESINPCQKNAKKIGEKLASGKRITSEDVNSATEFCQMAEEAASRINRTSAAREREHYKIHEYGKCAEEYELISKLINESRQADAAEKAVFTLYNEKLSALMEKCGLDGGVIRVFGERHKHFIACGEDEGGSKISSGELRRGIEEIAGVRLGTPEYYRNGKMALMECGVARSFAVECATASVAKSGSEISGDTVCAFESSDDRFYALLSDGMGSGEIAGETSRFVTEFMSKILNFGASHDTVLHLLNHTLRKRTHECSASVDLFELDLLSGDAMFIKSGAAPSYVKRDSSIFRIKSQTAPLGLMKSIDSEKIRVEIKGEDYIIILSDGVSQSSEDAPWLLELLSKSPKPKLKDYADLILSEATKNSRSHDDISVMVLKVIKL